MGNIQGSDGIYPILSWYIRRITIDTGYIYRELLNLAERLSELNSKKYISLNHSIMEILVAYHLMSRGYTRVQVEEYIEGLSPDVVGYRKGLTIVEIETGFVPAEYSHEPITYLTARVASKIARYSNLGDTFILAVPIYYIPPIHPLLFKKPGARSQNEIEELKYIIDRYYKNPPIGIDEIKRAKLDKILVLLIDEGKIIEINPEEMKNLITNIYGFLNRNP